LVKQAFETLEMDDNLVEIAQMLLTTKLLHPSGDYHIAIAQGSNMRRIGRTLFGHR
jgi:uncharacterized pyridoxal phosphate-containing UPF0001 family protein